MKKAIALLLALALVGGVVFAEDEATTVKTAYDPVITYGVSSSFAWNMIRSNAATLPKDKSVDFESVGLPIGGFDFSTGQLFKVEPWAKVAFGPFWMKATVGYKQSRRNPAGGTEGTEVADQIVKIATGLSFENLAITNTFVLDDNNYGDSLAASVPPAAYNDLEFTVSKDNVEAGVLFRTNMVGATNVTMYGDVFYALDNMVARDAYFAISNIFDLMKVTVGGTDVNWSTNFRPYGMFPSTSVINQVTAARTSNGLWWSGDNLATVPVVAEINLEKFVGMPISFNVGSVIYSQIAANDDTALVDWFEGNQIYDVNFAFDGIGNGNVGFIPGFAKARTLEALGVYTIDSRKAAVTNTIYGDFKFTAVPNLTLNMGFDYSLKNYVSAKAADATGSGSATDPFVTKDIGYSVFALGLEAKYDLKDVLAGLVVNAGIYPTLALGGDWETKNGAAYVAPDAGTNYVAANYTEATRLARSLGAQPTIIALRADYKVDANNALYLMNLLTPAAAAFTASGLGTKVELGYYTTNALTAGYALTAGKGKLAFDLGYTLFLGLPTDTDLGITAAADKEAYKTFLGDTYRPLSFKVTYTASF